MAIADWPADALEVGRIVGAWGVKGWIKVQPFAADPQALFAARRWFIKPPEDARSLRRGVAPLTGVPNEWPPLLEILQAKPHGDAIVAQVRGIDDRGAAEALRGARIFVPRSGFPPAGVDEYYWADLIGLAVVNRQGERLGVVTGLLDTGPHSVLRVQAEGMAPAEAPEQLIPFVAAYVDAVSLEARCITVDWGLDY